VGCRVQPLKSEPPGRSRSALPLNVPGVPGGLVRDATATIPPSKTPSPAPRHWAGALPASVASGLLKTEPGVTPVSGKA